jgi:hypothetical protein
MFRTTASRSTWAVLATLAILLLARSAQAGLVLQLSSSSSSVNSAMTITTAGTYTFYLFAEVSDANSSSYSGNYLNQVYANLVSTSNSALATGGSSGISGFTLAPAWGYQAQSGTANTVLGVAGAQSWGSNTSSSGDIVGIVSSAGTQAAALQTSSGTGTGPSNGFAVNAYTWAFLVGTATVTVNNADLLGAGTVDYVAQLTTQSTVKAKWWQTNKGATAQTIGGTATSSATSGATQSPTFVISYAPAGGSAVMTLAGVAPTSATIIQGGSATFGATAGNSGSAALSYSLSSTGSGVLAGTSSAFSNAALAAGGSDPLSLTVGAGALPGTGTLTWHVTASTGGSPADVIDNLTVLAHAAPSLTVTSVSIGNVLGNAQVSAPTTTLQNAANPNGASLQVTGLSAGLSGTTVGTLLPQGASTTLTAVINTSSASYAPGSFTANVADDQTYAGKGATSLADQTLTVTGAIAWAAATSSTSFGPALSATVTGSAGTPAAPLFSKVDVATSPGAFGTQASLLGSGSVTGQSVTMAWRQATAAEQSAKAPIISDVVALGGTALPTTAYVLEMSFDPTNWAVASHLAQLEAAGKIYLVSDTSGSWRNAVLDNTLPAGSNAVADFQGSYQAYLAFEGAPTLPNQLGAWGVGVDPASGQDVVWAVLNHASDFAVVPEPATMAFLLLGGLGMTGAALKRRTAKRQARA